MWSRNGGFWTSSMPGPARSWSSMRIPGAAPSAMRASSKAGSRRACSWRVTGAFLPGREALAKMLGEAVDGRARLTLLAGAPPGISSRTESGPIVLRLFLGRPRDVAQCDRGRLAHQRCRDWPHAAGRDELRILSSRAAGDLAI